MRAAIVLLVVLAIATAVVVARTVLGRTPLPAVVEASGTIEATESDLSPKVQGRLVDLRVRDGDSVRKGEVVAVLERVDPSFDVEQARATVVAAQAQAGAAQAAYALQRSIYQTTLAQAGAGVRIAVSRVGQAGENLGIERHAATLGIDQAQAAILSARSAYDHARIDLGRAQALVRTGDEAKQQLDDATNAYASAGAQLRAANDNLVLAHANSRTVHVRELDVSASRSEHSQSVASLESAQAEAGGGGGRAGRAALVDERRAQATAAEGALAQARAALARSEDQLRETKLLAPYDGFVISHNFEVGDLVQPGSSVMTTGDLVHPYVNVFVSETDLPHIKTGARADVTVDGMPGRTYAGTVTEISNTAEFTPENVQTREERIEYLVFRVKVQFNDSTGTLKPGLPVDAAIHI
jgi:HlyD family secretion protein